MQGTLWQLQRRVRVTLKLACFSVVHGTQPCIAQRYLYQKS